MPPKKFIPCSCHPPIPQDQQVACAVAAVQENPANAPPPGALASLLGTALVGNVDSPQFIAVMVGKYWGSKGKDFAVKFLDNPTQACRTKILAHMNAWNTRCNVSFRETAGSGDIRISRGRGGYWSYLGTDILSIPTNQPTMNLEGFTENTSEAEYKRVVRHETGHSLGCPHEHMRASIIQLLDVNKTITYFQQTQGWDRNTTIQQVLKPLEESSLMGSPTVDQDSIMTYALPSTITKNGKPIVGGSDITENDYAFMAKLYPKPTTPVQPPPPATDTTDVTVSVAALVKALSDIGYTVTKS